MIGYPLLQGLCRPRIFATDHLTGAGSGVSCLVRGAPGFDAMPWKINFRLLLGCHWSIAAQNHSLAAGLFDLLDG